MINIAAPAAAPTMPPIKAAGGPELLPLSTACKFATKEGVVYTVGITVVTNTSSPSGKVEVRVTGIWLEIVTSAVLKCVINDPVGCVVVSDVMLRLVDVMVDPTGSLVMLLGVLTGGGELDVVIGTEESLVVLSTGVLDVGTKLLVVGGGSLLLVVGDDSLLVVVGVDSLLVFVGSVSLLLVVGGGSLVIITEVVVSTVDMVLVGGEGVVVGVSIALVVVMTGLVTESVVVGLDVVSVEVVVSEVVGLAGGDDMPELEVSVAEVPVVVVGGSEEVAGVVEGGAVVVGGDGVSLGVVDDVLSVVAELANDVFVSVGDVVVFSSVVFV